MNCKAHAIILAFVLTASSFSCTSSYLVKLSVHPSFSGKARIIGFISDKETAEMLIGANIVLEGTSLGAGTNIDGYYRIDGVPAGKYNVRVTYIGYQPIYHFELVVEPDKLIRLDFEIEQSIIQVFEQNVRQ